MFKKLKQTLENSVDAATSAVTSASGGSHQFTKITRNAGKRAIMFTCHHSARSITLDSSYLSLSQCFIDSQSGLANKFVEIQKSR